LSLFAGEGVKKMTISLSDLEDNYLMEKDGEFTLFPKVAGQVRMIDIFIYKIVIIS
jgi:hypothetical protein